MLPDFREFERTKRRIAIDHELFIKRLGGEDSTQFGGTCQEPCSWARASDSGSQDVRSAHELHLDRLTYERLEAGAEKELSWHD